MVEMGKFCRRDFMLSWPTGIAIVPPPQPEKQVCMDSLRTVLNPILADETLTRGLRDPEARMLIDWLVERIEGVLAEEWNDLRTGAEIRVLCRHARCIGRFVSLWEQEQGAALQLAACERFGWPLPSSTAMTEDVMEEILRWERTHMVTSGQC
jgi:hypothetical protein